MAIYKKNLESEESNSVLTLHILNRQLFSQGRFFKPINLTIHIMNSDSSEFKVETKIIEVITK